MIFRQPPLLLAFLLLMSCASIGLIVVGQTFPNANQDARKPVAKTKGAEKLFKQNCVKCHGADGAGQTAFGETVGATDFTDPAWQKQVDDQRLVNSMTHGRGQMPPFGKKLSKDQITTLLTYVRAFKK